MNIEALTTAERQPQTSKSEFAPNLVVKNEFDSSTSDSRSQWSVEKQMAWNDSFVRQSCLPTVNKTWPADYSQKKLHEGYHHCPPNNINKVPDIKQEPYSWTGAEQLHKSRRTDLSPPKPWLEQDAVKQEEILPSSYTGAVPYGYQVSYIILQFTS